MSPTTMSAPRGGELRPEPRSVHPHDAPEAAAPGGPRTSADPKHLGRVLAGRDDRDSQATLADRGDHVNRRREGPDAVLGHSLQEDGVLAVAQPADRLRERRIRRGALRRVIPREARKGRTPSQRWWPTPSTATGTTSPPSTTSRPSTGSTCARAGENQGHDRRPTTHAPAWFTIRDTQSRVGPVRARPCHGTRNVIAPFFFERSSCIVSL